jgi:hypothetical protein
MNKEDIMGRYNRKPVFGYVLFCILYCAVEAGAFTSLSDCLITSDIGVFAFRGSSANMGNGSGIVGLTGHFQDHTDVVCSGTYSNINEVRGLPVEEARQKILSVDVQVTQHAGSDSDKWLLHEVEDGYRDPDVLETNLTEGTVLRLIDGNRVFNWGAGTYTWLSGNNLVVRIEYTDLTGMKPEPLEVVRAYLGKFPSSITLTDAQLKSRDHSEQWIKDEMERRLWLCDKWFLQVQMGKVEINDSLQTIVKHMNVFLDYREKYYGVAKLDEKAALWGYLGKKDGTSIKNKLTEYKNWWNVNKARAINLP